jgi:hypothetical protein
MQTYGNAPQGPEKQNASVSKFPAGPPEWRDVRRRVLYKILEKVYFARARAGRARCVGVQIHIESYKMIIIASTAIKIIKPLRPDRSTNQRF